jgi:hypothetical protein
MARYIAHCCRHTARFVKYISNLGRTRVRGARCFLYCGVIMTHITQHPGDMSVQHVAMHQKSSNMIFSRA